MNFPLIVAHRGYSAVAPENTLAAVCQALEAGVRACEVDVRLTRDKHVVVMHDDRVDRTTDGTGALRDMTLRELRLLDAGSWKDPRYAGEKVPTLAEALALMKGRGQLVVEIKDEGMEEHVAEVIKSMNAVSQTTIIAFSLEVCRRMRTLLPAVGALWLVGGDSHNAEELARLVLEAGLQGVSAYHGLVTETFMDCFLRRGLSVWAWTVNEGSEARRLARVGVVSITTDDPLMLFYALAQEE